MNETAACVLSCALLALPSRTVCQEGPYDPTSRWQRELQKKKRFRRQNNKFACVSHIFIHFFAASAGLRFGGVEASPPQKNAPPPFPILLS